jgi:hypothetical protein
MFAIPPRRGRAVVRAARGGRMWSRNFSSGGMFWREPDRSDRLPSTDVTLATTVDGQSWLFGAGENPFSGRRRGHRPSCGRSSSQRIGPTSIAPRQWSRRASHRPERPSSWSLHRLRSTCACLFVRPPLHSPPACDPRPTQTRTHSRQRARSLRPCGPRPLRQTSIRRASLQASASSGRPANPRPHSPLALHRGYRPLFFRRWRRLPLSEPANPCRGRGSRLRPRVSRRNHGSPA